MTDQQIHIAVLTGDLVNSTELGAEKIVRAFRALEDSARRQEDWHGAPLHFTRHRGDGWQVVLAKPEMALRSALAFRAALKALGEEFDSYMGIAEGLHSGTIGDDLNDETSDIFRESGTTLEIAKVYDNPRIWHISKQGVHAATTLADVLSQNWTQAQASALLPFLNPKNQPSQSDVAEKLGKSRQAVSKAIEAAHYKPLIHALESIESKGTPQ